MTNRSGLFCLLPALLFFLQIVAQSPVTDSRTLTPAPPSEVGLSPERLERIDNMIREAIENKEIPGAVALIARNGKIAYHKAFGTADATGRELETDHIFRIASQTKAITATAVMMLWEEGKFKLDDPISKYIPEFKNPQILVSFNEKDSSYTSKPAEKEISIRHLLTHTSGIGYGMIDQDHRIRKIYQKAGITDGFTVEKVILGENIKKLAKLPLHQKPGEKFVYGEGLDVLGYFVEVISGQDFDVFLKQRIFDPLGMDDTRFYLPESKAHRLVGVQENKENSWVIPNNAIFNLDYPVAGAKTFFSGGAGLSGTARDYAAFLQMFLNKGTYDGNRLLSRTTVEMMMKNQVGELFDPQGNKYYGIAFAVVTPEGEARGGEGSAGTFDWGGYFNTQYFADPEEQIIGIILKQTSGPTGDQTAWKFRQMVMAAVND